MRLNDPLRHCEAQARTRRFAGEEGLEHARLRIIGEPWPGIADDDAPKTWFNSDFDLHPPFWCRGFGRVLHEIQEHLAELQ